MANDFADKVEIQTLAQRYADAVMRRDAEDWGNTWAEDGVWYLGMPTPIEGREAIVGLWNKAMGGYPVVLHIVQPGIIEVNGDTATARFYIQENIVDGDGNHIWVVGVYNDELTKATGEWKFKLRKFDTLYRGPNDLSGDLSGYTQAA